MEHDKTNPEKDNENKNEKDGTKKVEQVKEQECGEKDLKEVGKFLDEQIETEYKRRATIIESLNKFGNLVIPQYKPLKYSIQDDFVLFKYARERLKYFQDYLENDSENSFDHLCCFCFTALFLGDEDFKYENLEERIKYFDVILNCKENKDDPNQPIFLKALIDDVNTKNYSFYIISLLNEKFKKDFFIFMLLLIMKYQEDLFPEVLIRKIQYKNDIKIDFDYSDLSGLSKETIVKDLYDIFVNDNNDKKDVTLIHLVLDKEAIKEGPKFSLDEVYEYIYSLDDRQKEKKMKVKNYLEENFKEKKNTSIKSIKTENKKDNNIEISKNKENNKDGKIEKNINNEEKGKEKEKENDDIKNADEKNTKIIEELSFKINNMENNIKIMNEKNVIENENNKKRIEMYETQLNDYKAKLGNYENKLEKYENKFESYIKQNELDKREIKAKNLKIKKLEKNYNKLRLDMTNKSNQLDKIQSELDIIKIREGIKAFIDFIYASLKLTKVLSYDEKVYSIYDKLNSFSDAKKYDIKLIKLLKSAVYNFYKKYKSGNDLAHSMDLNRSIIEQLFQIIKPKDDKDKYSNLETILKDKMNIESLMKKIIMNRKENYFLKDILFENDRIILSQVTDLDNAIALGSG